MNGLDYRGTSGRLLQHVGAEAFGLLQGLLFSQLPDLFVVSVEQDLGSLPPAELGRAGPMGTVEQPLAVAGFLKRFEGRRVFVPENPGNQARDGIDDDGCSELASAQDVI